MKKILYTMSMAAAILFTSCAEDKGTSFEVTDANRDERVNPSHIRGYYIPGTAGNTTGTLESDQTNQSATTAQADVNAAQQANLTAVDLVYAYYNNSNPALSYRLPNYRFSATQRMAGSAEDANRIQSQSRTGTTNDMSNKNINNNNNNSNNNNNTSGTTMAPSSTTADAQSRGAADSRKTGDNEKRIIDYKKKPDNSGSKTKKRLTPEQ